MASALGSVVAECITLPTDVAKVRLQVQKEVSGSGLKKYDGMTGCMRTVAREEVRASDDDDEMDEP